MMVMQSPGGADAPGQDYRKRTRFEHEAAAVLRRDGCEVFRTDGRRPGVNLIAMAGQRFRFVCIRRRSTPAGSVRAVAEDYAEDLAELRRYLSGIVAAELWIWSPGDGHAIGAWRHFRVYAGGIQEIGHV